MSSLLLLGFGSSARRGATGWTDRPRIRAVIDALRPDATVDGASPSDRRVVVGDEEELFGGDLVFHEEARRHFAARGLGPALARRCPYDPEIDGPRPRGFFARNARQFLEHRPALAVAGILGKAGTPMSSGSAHMLGICLRGLRGAPPIPVLVLRDDGLERSATPPLRTMRLLHGLDPSLRDPYHATNAWLKGETSREEVLAALAFAAEGSRWAPWIEAVRATLSR